MAVEEYKTQFKRIIQRRGYGSDKYIDSREEADILRDCVNEGIPLESAQAVLREVCHEQGHLLETDIKAKVNMTLKASLSNDGKIDEEEFIQAVRVAMTACKNLQDEIYCKRLVARMIEDGEAPIKKGFLSNWFNRVKKEVGLE
ncbi:hypothetical protein Isop_1467 [Isosphaera pallida ATCC 43644]|jgi:hypothetical protein|uniref:Uncharacterized protein n=1 Tax=Isosphaera pallida (strain ATCC 43644 / DSM 9630 / IS1B) TaxID=575540 RepID=E8QY62_ISOPI|nr:hypothetical protein [Isosphaera pallida]ADV62052.1 hypothetical protein Isop_1467 [Isosphaera pallida ATCC 43644]